MNLLLIYINKLYNLEKMIRFPKYKKILKKINNRIYSIQILFQKKYYSP